MARKEMSGFGRQIWTLMASRGITTRRELSRVILERTGEVVSSHVVRNCLFGHSSVPSTLPSLLADALDLDEYERSDLAMAYAYGQHVGVSEIGLAAS